MKEVGHRLRSQNINVGRALAALQEIHDSGYVHGDARRSNLLQISNQYKWCDLQNALKFDHAHREYYCEIDRSALSDSIFF